MVHRRVFCILCSSEIGASLLKDGSEASSFSPRRSASPMLRVIQARALAGLHETLGTTRGIVIPRVKCGADLAFRSAAILDFATCVAIASIRAGDRQS